MLREKASKKKLEAIKAREQSEQNLENMVRRPTRKPKRANRSLDYKKKRNLRNRMNLNMSVGRLQKYKPRK